MPVPTTAEYSVAAKVAAHESFRDLIDGGAGAGFIRIRDADDVLLAEIPLEDPCGAVNQDTGQLVFAIDGSSTALLDGVAAYGEFCNSGSITHLSLPAAAGGSAVTGFVVLNSLVFAAGVTVSVSGAVIG